MVRHAVILLLISCLVSCGRSTNDRQEVMNEEPDADQVQNDQRLEIGSNAPDFSLPNTEGKVIHLSDFRGKYLFLDFWASWCLPCRKENPAFVKIYEQFRSQNFEMLGISFDKKKDNWIKAIASDELKWPQVSDLKYFDSDMIELYNIVNVPTTILLDPEGKIIGMNLHAQELEKLLEELF